MLQKKIKLKHNKGKLVTGDEAIIESAIEATGPFFVRTQDDRTEWLDRSDFIIVGSVKLALPVQFYEYLQKHGFEINNSGSLIQNHYNRVTIFSDQMKFYKWIDQHEKNSEWMLYYTLTGIEHLNLDSFKQIMKAFDVTNDFTSCLDIAHENFKLNNH